MTKLSHAEQVRLEYWGASGEKPEVVAPISRWEVTVNWEDTDRPFTRYGPRRYGSFKTNIAKAWLWAMWFCFLNERAAVHVKKAT